MCPWHPVLLGPDPSTDFYSAVLKSFCSLESYPVSLLKNKTNLPKTKPECQQRGG